MGMRVEDFLEHYGVKGMRWGVRRDRPAKVRVLSSDAKRVEKIEAKTRSKGQRSLTNKELNDFNKRLQLEKTQRSFIDLDPKSKKAMLAGAAFISGIAATVGREVVKETAKNHAQTQVKKMLAKKAAEAAGGG